MGCSESDLSFADSVTLEGLGVSMEGVAEPNFVKLLSANPCFKGGSIRAFNLGSERKIECDDLSAGYWIVTYVAYINEYNIRVKACFHEGEEGTIPCPNHSTQAACEAAGCFWYNGGCHTNDEEIPIGDDTDYDRIKGDVKDSIAPVLTGIAGVDQGVKDVKALINRVNSGMESLGDNLLGGLTGVISDVGDSLQSSIDGLLGDLTGIIDGIQTYLSNEIAELTGSVTTGFVGLGDKIDGLKFPTLDSIKDVFLDVCEDLATALWNRIIDEIERRYPDDEEESD